MSLIDLRLEDDDPWEVGQKIFDILRDFVQSVTPPSASQAAASLAALYPDNRPLKDGEAKESAETFLLEMWEVVVKVAVQLEPGSTEQEKLALLLKTLRDTKPEQTLLIWNRPTVLWKELPLLGPTMTETFNSITPHFPPIPWKLISQAALDDNALYSNHHAWAGDRLRAHSFFTFAALLTRDGFDSSSFALYLLSSALEHPLVTHAVTVGKADPKTPRSDGPALQTVIAAAEFWIAHCNAVLYAHSKAGKAGPRAKGDLWAGQSGFSLARYELWKQRFGDISRDAEVAQGTRDMAARAADGMKEGS